MDVCIHLKNLPPSASNIHVREFFDGLAIPTGGVKILGGPEGDAFVEFMSEEDLLRGKLRNGQRLHGYPVSLSLASRMEMFKVIEQAKQRIAQVNAVVTKRAYSPPRRSSPPPADNSRSVYGGGGARLSPPPRRGSPPPVMRRLSPSPRRGMSPLRREISPVRRREPSPPPTRRRLSPTIVRREPSPPPSQRRLSPTAVRSSSSLPPFRKPALENNPYEDRRFLDPPRSSSSAQYETEYRQINRESRYELSDLKDKESQYLYSDELPPISRTLNVTAKPAVYDHRAPGRDNLSPLRVTINRRDSQRPSLDEKYVNDHRIDRGLSPDLYTDTREEIVEKRYVMSELHQRRGQSPLDDIYESRAYERKRGHSPGLSPRHPVTQKSPDRRYRLDDYSHRDQRKPSPPQRPAATSTRNLSPTLYPRLHSSDTESKPERVPFSGKRKTEEEELARMRENEMKRIRLDSKRNFYLPGQDPRYESTEYEEDEKERSGQFEIDDRIRKLSGQIEREIDHKPKNRERSPKTDRHKEPEKHSKYKQDQRRSRSRENSLGKHTAKPRDKAPWDTKKAPDIKTNPLASVAALSQSKTVLLSPCVKVVNLAVTVTSKDLREFFFHCVIEDGGIALKMAETVDSLVAIIKFRSKLYARHAFDMDGMSLHKKVVIMSASSEEEFRKSKGWAGTRESRSKSRVSRSRGSRSRSKSRSRSRSKSPYSRFRSRSRPRRRSRSRSRSPLSRRNRFPKRRSRSPARGFRSDRNPMLEGYLNARARSLENRYGSKPGAFLTTRGRGRGAPRGRGWYVPNRERTSFIEGNQLYGAKFSKKILSDTLSSRNDDKSPRKKGRVDKSRHTHRDKDKTSKNKNKQMKILNSNQVSGIIEKWAAYLSNESTIVFLVSKLNKGVSADEVLSWFKNHNVPGDGVLLLTPKRSVRTDLASPYAYVLQNDRSSFSAVRDIAEEKDHPITECRQKALDSVVHQASRYVTTVSTGCGLLSSFKPSKKEADTKTADAKKPEKDPEEEKPVFDVEFNNCPLGTTEQEVTEAFTEFKPIEKSVKKSVEKETSVSFLIRFASCETAEKAVKIINKRTFKGSITPRAKIVVHTPPEVKEEEDLDRTPEHVSNEDNMEDYLDDQDNSQASNIKINVARQVRAANFPVHVKEKQVIFFFADYNPVCSSLRRVLGEEGSAVYFVSFENDSDAEVVVEKLNNKVFCGAPISLSLVGGPPPTSLSGILKKESGILKKEKEGKLMEVRATDVPSEATEEQMTEFLAEYNPVPGSVKKEVALDFSTQFTFAFPSRTAAEEAVKKLGGSDFLGQPISLTLVSKELSDSSTPERYEDSPDDKTEKNFSASIASEGSVFVRAIHFPKDTTEEEAAEFFKHCNPVAGSVTKTISKRRGNIVFILQFASKQAAEAAMKAKHRSIYKGCQIVLMLATDLQ